jgi:hypothetical protein
MTNSAAMNFAMFKVMSFCNDTIHHVKCALQVLQQSKERGKISFTKVDNLSPVSVNNINTPPGSGYYSQLPDVIPTTTTVSYSNLLPQVSISQCETVPRSSVVSLVTVQSGGGSGFRIRQCLETTPQKPTVSDSISKQFPSPEETSHNQTQIELQLQLSEYQQTLQSLDGKLKDREEQQLKLHERMESMAWRINQLQQELACTSEGTELPDHPPVQIVKHLNKEGNLTIHEQVQKSNSSDELLLQSVQQLQQLLTQSLIIPLQSYEYPEYAMEHQPHDLEHHGLEPQQFATTLCSAVPLELGKDMQVINQKEDVISPAQQTDVMNQQTTPLTVPTTDNQDIGGVLRMHKLKLLSSTVTKFNGDESDYQGFKCRFSTMIDSMTISDQDKGVILFMCMEDEVIDCLGNLTEEGGIDYHKLWKQLDEEYLTPQNGLFSHFVALSSVATWTTCDTLSKLEKLYKFTRLHFLALRRLEAEIQAEGFSVVLLSKLIGTTCDRVSSMMIESNGKPVIPAILEIMKEEINILKLQEEAAKWNQNVPDKDEVHQSTPNYHTDELTIDITAHTVLSPQAGELPKFKCIFCQSNGHESNRCRRYRTRREFQRELYKQYRCYNCMEEGHQSWDCLTVKMCTLCEDYRKHSPLLCNNYKS